MNSAVAQIGLAVIAVLVTAPFLRRALVSTWQDPLRFPQARWGVPEAVFTACVAGFFLLMAFGSSGREVRIDLRAVIASAVLYGAITLVVVGFLLVRGHHLATAFGLDRWRWSTPLASLAAFTLVVPWILASQFITYRLLGPSAEPQPMVTFLMQSTGWVPRLAVAFVAVVAAPLTEELIFRGCVYGIARSFGGRLAALVFSATVFALIHGHLPSFPGLFILAIALALVYERTGTLWASIGLHALFNAVNVVLAICWPHFME